MRKKNNRKGAKDAKKSLAKAQSAQRIFKKLTAKARRARRNLSQRRKVRKGFKKNNREGAKDAKYLKKNFAFLASWREILISRKGAKCAKDF